MTSVENDSGIHTTAESMHPPQHVATSVSSPAIIPSKTITQPGFFTQSGTTPIDRPASNLVKTASTSNGNPPNKVDNKPISQELQDLLRVQAFKPIEDDTSKGKEEVSYPTCFNERRHRRQDMGLLTIGRKRHAHSNAEDGDSNEATTGATTEEESHPSQTGSHSRHSTGPPCSLKSFQVDWRMKERFKTVSVALVLCLNIGVEPPDVLKTKPCAKLETWLDPSTLPPPKALETIGRNLQQQYEVWQPRARYKLSLDPTVEETKKLCTSLRRHAKEERVLFHYNGHGVPKPTANGEVWVFNKTYTQYIPVSMFEVQTWLGEPSIFVYDCSSAGHILNAVKKVAAQKDSNSFPQSFHQHPPLNQTVSSSSLPPASNNSTSAPAPLQRHPSSTLSNGSFSMDFIQFAACRADEVLPMNPDLPADLFTSCLTTPIEIALRVYILQHPHLKDLSVDMSLKLPGRLNDRRTPLGELNWIFTAITDTIAWNVLPTDLFKRLFRQDLMVAALFRNFLLADRIMRWYQCTPQCTPPLPSTHHHPLWNSWDLAVDMCLVQLPALVAAENGGPQVEYRHSTFFTEQLTALDIWLTHGSVIKKPPEQVPIVLQVLLSQVHRLRALVLLCRFLELGAWAVQLALAVGIFPYVLKLLQSPAAELKPVLVFIWTRILAVDTTCQADLMKDSVYTYFVNILSDSDSSISNSPEHKTMCAFILSKLSYQHPAGQQGCLKSGVLKGCLRHLDSSDSYLKQWCTLCIAEIWNDCEDAKWAGIHIRLYEKLCELLLDTSVEVRASATYALGNLLGFNNYTEQVTSVEHIVVIHLVMSSMDGSPIVRRELLVALSRFIKLYTPHIVSVASEMLEQITHFQQGINIATTDESSFRRRSVDLFSTRYTSELDSCSEEVNQSSFYTVYRTVWLCLLGLAADPSPEITFMAQSVVDSIMTEVSLSRNFNWDQHILHLSHRHQTHEEPKQTSSPGYSPNSLEDENFGKLSRGPRVSLRRTASTSLFNSLRNLSVFGMKSNSNPSEREGGFTRSQGRLADTHSHSLGALNADPPASHHHPFQYEDIGQASFNSNFYEWSCHHFVEPLTKPSLEKLEPGSIEFNTRLWRQGRNKQSLFKARSTYPNAGFQKWEQIKYFNISPKCCKKVLFHEYERQLVVCGEKDFGVYNYETGAKLSTHTLKSFSKVSTALFINEADVSALLIGTDDGMVKVYRDYDKEDMSLITSWRALNDYQHYSIHGGLALDWQQRHFNLIAAGDTRVIRIWNGEKEICEQVLLTGSTSSVLSLTSEHVEGNMIMTGSRDGVIRIYDKRKSSKKSLIITYKSHSNPIVQLQLQHGFESSRKLVSVCSHGDIKLWDFRQSTPTLSWDAQTSGGPITAASVHNELPLVAMGASHQFIKVFNFESQCLGHIRNYTGLFGQRMGLVTDLHFHPIRPILAAGNMDGFTPLFGMV